MTAQDSQLELFAMGVRTPTRVDRPIGAKFAMLNASSKFAICGLPLRVDCYKTCAFGCHYCFANSRKIMEFSKSLQVGDTEELARRMERVYGRGEVNPESFIDKLMENRITWHCGGMSDPFQPCEGRFHVTRELVRLSRDWGVGVLFSTKSDNLHGCEFDPALHSFQFSVTNVANHSIEPGVPRIESRRRLFGELKARGFKVGIRLQPFIPGISDERVVEMFADADHFTIEGLKLVPQNAEHVDMVLRETGVPKECFVQMGLLNLAPETRKRLYAPVLDALKRHGIPYSIADNDMHDVSDSRCCCGDALVAKSSGFDTTAMCRDFGTGYTLADVEARFAPYAECRVNHLFTSNRQEGCRTVRDFFRQRFHSRTSPFSPLFLHRELPQMELF